MPYRRYVFRRCDEGLPPSRSSCWRADLVECSRAITRMRIRGGSDSWKQAKQKDPRAEEWGMGANTTRVDELVSANPRFRSTAKWQTLTCTLLHVFWWMVGRMRPFPTKYQEPTARGCGCSVFFLFRVWISGAFDFFAGF